jgi:hypothetical protein
MSLNSSIGFDLSNRRYIAVRGEVYEERSLRFDGVRNRTPIVVNGHEIKTVADISFAEDLGKRDLGENVYGRIMFREAWDQYPEYLELKLYVDTQTFESIRTVDLKSSQVQVRFTFKPKNEDTIEQDGGVVFWKTENEPGIPAEEFHVAILPKEEAKPEPGPNNPPTFEQPITPFEREALNRMTITEKSIRWCLVVLIGLLGVMIFKK